MTNETPLSESATDHALGAALLQRARHAIATALNIPHPDNPTHPALQQPGATFVTLTENGQLRGCIGSLTAWRPLDEDVYANAIAAAFQDPRFAPLRHDGYHHIRVEVSLLTPARPMQFSSEADALAQLRPNIDGVIFECRSHRATFLPQVWEDLSNPLEFMSHLKRKAGLPADYWDNDVKLSRYEVKKWKE